MTRQISPSLQFGCLAAKPLQQFGIRAWPRLLRERGKHTVADLKHMQ